MTRPRKTFSREEKERCWSLWRKGLGYSDIAREMNSKPGTIFGLVRINGGYPAPIHKRSPRHLSLPEREEISRGIANGESIRKMAAKLSRAPSTISREIARHGGRRYYRAHKADSKAWSSARRKKSCKLAMRPYLARVVTEKLNLKWAPQQISGWLKIQYGIDSDMYVSHETIYKTLYMPKRTVLEKDLMGNLRFGHKMRHSKKHTTRGDRGSIRIVNGRSIHERPEEVARRKKAGHWEGDLISGSGNTHIATLVERSSLYTILVQVDGKDTDSVVSGLIREMSALPKALRKSLTWDRGMELAKHQHLHEAIDTDIYFCDPQSPWQRGINENTNGLLRQFFPKKTPLGHFEQHDLNEVANLLNNRPRKTLGYRTPEEVILSDVAMTG